MKVLNVLDLAASYTLYIVHRQRELLSTTAALYLDEVLDFAEDRIVPQFPTKP
jgi:hypothetical protein